MRFISPKIDFAFKKIFGDRQSKDILISFLNAIVYQGNATIKDLEIIDPCNVGEVRALREPYLDTKKVGSFTLVKKVLKKVVVLRDKFN